MRRHGETAAGARMRMVGVVVERAQLTAIARRRAMERRLEVLLGVSAIYFAVQLLAWAFLGFRVVAR